MTVAYSNSKPIINSVYSAIEQMIVSNNATAPNTKLDVSAGLARDQSDTFDINLGDYRGSGASANATTTIDTAAVGINGIDTGELAATKMYYVYAVDGAQYGNSAGCIVSLNAPDTGPIMPYGYALYRHIGYAATDGSKNFLPMKQLGAGNYRKFLYNTIRATGVTSGNATTATAVSLTNLVPAVDGLNVHVYSALTPGAASRTLTLYAGDLTSAEAIVTGQVTSVVVTTVQDVVAELNSGAPRIGYAVANSGDAAAVSVAGFDFEV